ncbi:MAG: HAD-IA family hydrolase [Planctomycetes bacterium]|nr:HAD-IA family hydrolase [Planctomycetota bacterium]
MSPQIAVDLLRRKHWIFDLDGTLTLPVHDFPALRLKLGLTEAQGTLEGIQKLPPAQRDDVMAKLNQIGWDYATQSKAQPGAVEFLQFLAAQGCQMGVVTRNNHVNLVESLRRIDMEKFFADECRYSRDQPPAKPSPEPLRKLLTLWQADASDGVMVGDAIYDLQAGKAAGTATLYFDSYNHGGLEDLADLRITQWQQLLAFANI